MKNILIIIKMVKVSCAHHAVLRRAVEMTPPPCSRMMRSSYFTARNALEVHSQYAVIIFACGVCHLSHWNMGTRIVINHVQPSKSGNGATGLAKCSGRGKANA